MFDDLIVELDAPPNRRAKCPSGKERHLTEAAVMLAYGMQILRTVPSVTAIDLHPDGEHAKRFEIVRWLAVVPHTETTLRLAQKLAPRAKEAGIEIVLVDELGQVVEVRP
jgi:hypothetical protein